MRIHGGYGYVSEFPVERFYRDAARLLFVPVDDDTLRADLAARLCRRPMSALGLARTAAMVSATVFTAWALYVSLVEHPARIDSGAAAGRAQFRPSYRRAAPWQASFAAIALVAGAAAAALTAPLDLAPRRPRPRRRHPADPRRHHAHQPPPARRRPVADAEVLQLLHRWGRLHAIRTVLGAATLLLFLYSLGSRS